jgi:UMF1 family MFS transporter
MAVAEGSVARPGLLARLGALTPSGRPIVPVGWALYDFANTIFSFAVVSGAIGLWLTDDARFGERDGNVILSLAVVASTLLCIVPTAVIGASPAVLGVVLFVIANFGYQAALIYYDSTLKSVSRPETRGKLSGIGVAIGYTGTIFIGLLIFFAGIPVDSRFLIAAVLFGLFALPIFLVVREPGGGPPLHLADVVAGWSQLRTTIRHAAAVPGLLRFLLGRFFYSDAVNTIIVVMSVVTVEAMGLTPRDANLILLLLTVVAVGASFGWGVLVDRFGPKRTLMIVLASWAVGLVLGAVSLGVPGAPGLAMFLVAGAILGSGLGGVQVSDRVLLVRLAPPDRIGEFFGLYGLVGKGSQVIGQLLYGATILLLFDALGTGAYQAAVLSLLVTMLIGAWLLRSVSDRWTGSGELDERVVAIPPERLAPMSAPIEPR